HPAVRHRRHRGRRFRRHGHGRPPGRERTARRAGAAPRPRARGNPMSGGAGRTAGRRGASSESTAHLPDEQRRALRSAVRLEWFSIGYTCVALLVVGVVAGQSQAMRAAWIEDALTLLPPIAFLIAVRISRTAATARFPYGRHRAIDVAHVVAATALLVMGLILFGESALALINLEKPPIGVTV